jgi:uncharacterized membrane protein YjjP (DUF1212 family)
MAGPIDGRGVQFILDNLDKVSRMTRGNWLSVLGAGASAAFVTWMASPPPLDVHLLAVAAVGTAVTALVHLLQTIPDAPEAKAAAK